MVVFTPTRGEKIQLYWNERTKYGVTYSVLDVIRCVHGDGRGEDTRVLLEKCGKNDYVANLIIDGGRMVLVRPEKGGAVYSRDPVHDIRREVGSDRRAEENERALRRVEVRRLKDKMRGGRNASDVEQELPQFEGFITGKSKLIVDVHVFNENSLHFPNAAAASTPVADLKQLEAVLSLIPQHEFDGRDMPEMHIKHKLAISKLFGKGLQNKEVKNLLDSQRSSTEEAGGSAGGSGQRRFSPVDGVACAGIPADLLARLTKPAKLRELVNFEEYQLYAQFSCDCGLRDRESQRDDPQPFERMRKKNWSSIKAWGIYLDQPPDQDPRAQSARTGLATNYREDDADRALFERFASLRLDDGERSRGLQVTRRDSTATLNSDDTTCFGCGVDLERKAMVGCTCVFWDYEENRDARFNQWRNAKNEKPKQACTGCGAFVEAHFLEMLWDHHPHGRHKPEGCPKCIRLKQFCSADKRSVCDIYKLILKAIHPELSWRETDSGVMSEFYVDASKKDSVGRTCGGGEGSGAVSASPPERLRVMLKIEPQLFFISQAQAKQTLLEEKKYRKW
ncbi:unnamed protein product [Amoebophrya sp. A120]|nr:unnamed protein product [Amoebophrya sp. A120]|eukprot:GSA120T00001555001.1